MNKETSKILQSETDQLKKLREIVDKSIQEEKLVIDNLLSPPKELIKTSDRLSDKIAKFGGSWAFIVSFIIILFVWIIFNITAPKSQTFDPYPFILMNLVLSCIAALQAPVIMMSQNRQEEKDRKRAENDYLVNLKAELEIRAINEKIDLLLEEQIKVIYETQAKQIELLNKIEKKLQTK